MRSDYTRSRYKYDVYKKNPPFDHEKEERKEKGCSVPLGP